MKFRIVSTEEAFFALQTDWDKLYENQSCKSVFQTFTYNYHSWKDCLAKKGELFVIVGMNNEFDVLAIAPLYIDQKGKLRFMNDVHTDFTTFLYKEEALLFLGKMMLAVLKKWPKIKSLQLINLFDERLASQLNCHFPTHKLLYANMQYSSMRSVKESFPNNFLHLNHKQRNNLQRIQKKYNYQQHLYRQLTDAFPLELINALREKMIASGSRDENFLSVSQLSLIQHMYEKGLLVVNTIMNNDVVCAISLILEQEEEYVFWIDLYDEQKQMNLHAYCQFISSMCQEKASAYNMARGTYFYKMHNFSPEPYNLYAFSYHQKWMPFVIHSFRFSIKEGVKSLLRKKQY
jgi:hypothetical protein